MSAERPSDPLNRPLSTRTASLAVLAIGVTIAVLARLVHGSWSRVLTVAIVPAALGVVMLALWPLERRRGAPLPARWSCLLMGAAGTIGGAVAARLDPALVGLGEGLVTGGLFGAWMGVVWSRPPRVPPRST